jgi:hypothetical protein
MAWEGPTEDRPVWCAANAVNSGTPTAQSVGCTTQDPAAASGGADAQIASLQLPQSGAKGLAGDLAATAMPAAAPSYQKFTNQKDMGLFLVAHYNIRTPKDLTSCEVCHR